MPGLFVFLDHEKNMGLTSWVQAVLDAKKCIMMMVDKVRASRAPISSSPSKSLCAPSFPTPT